MTIGVAWNILAKDFDVGKTYHNLAKVNMVREFGQFLPEELKIKKEKRVERFIPVIHKPYEFQQYSDVMEQKAYSK